MVSPLEECSGTKLNFMSAYKTRYGFSFTSSLQKGVAEVSFEVSYTSASSGDVILTPSSGIVTLQDGENQTVVSLEIVDDTTPEETERLTVSLISTTGDAVIVFPTSIAVTIAPSDDPNGVFVFASNSTDLSVEEGDTLLMRYIEH